MVAVEDTVDARDGVIGDGTELGADRAAVAVVEEDVAVGGAVVAVVVGSTVDVDEETGMLLTRDGVVFWASEGRGPQRLSTMVSKATTGQGRTRTAMRTSLLKSAEATAATIHAAYSI